MSFSESVVTEVKNNADAFFNKHPNPMWIYDPESLNILAVNEAACELYNYTQEQMTSLTLRELRPPEEVSRLEAYLEQKSNHEFFNAGVWRHQTRTGKPLSVHLFVYPIQWGDRLCRLVVARDVSAYELAEKELKMEHRLLENLVESLPGFFFVLDSQGRLIRWNSRLEALCGLSAAQLNYRHAVNLFPRSERTLVAPAIEHAFEHGEAEVYTQYRDPAGRIRHIHFKANVLNFKEEAHLIGVGMDITSQRVAQDDLKIRSQAIERAMDGMSITDADGNIIDLNLAKLDLYGYKRRRDLIGKHWSILYSREEALRISKYIKNRLTKQDAWKGQAKGQRSDGSYFNQELTIAHLDNGGFVFICRDITQRLEREHRLKEALHEKKVLLNEIHHRVKNNLAVISSLLQLQAMEEENPEVAGKLLDSTVRIKTMATVHELMYGTGNLSEMEFSETIRKLMSGLLEIHRPSIPVEVVYRLEPVPLSINQAVPCSLIVNEVVTNALKHAFPQQDEGTITCELSKQGKLVELVIQDDGVGCPDNVSPQDPSSLGLTLINVLVQQLDAEYELDTGKEGGCRFCMRFNPVDEKSRTNNRRVE
jgi:PAS domain S-box-containing protein